MLSIAKNQPTLFGTLATRAYRTIWLLNELGLKYDTVPVEIEAGYLVDDEFLEVNPNGRVPAYADENGVFSESLSINLYLAKKHGGTFAPNSLVEDALSTQWTIWALTEVERPLFVIGANKTIFPEDYSAEEVALAEKKLQRPLRALERTLTGNYLLGDRFTVVDLNVASVLAMAKMGDFDLGSISSVVARYLDRCLDRPSLPDLNSVATPQRRPPRWREIIL